MMIDQPKLPTYSLTHFSAFSSGVARKPKIPRWIVRVSSGSARCEQVELLRAEEERERLVAGDADAVVDDARDRLPASSR